MRQPISPSTMLLALELAEKKIREFEGCAFKAYQDQGGVWTIGFGCTHNVVPGMVIDMAEAERRLEADLRDTCTRVLAQIDVDLNENQLAALLCFTFNEGSGHLAASTLEAKLNAGDYQGAAEQFPLWDKCRGQVIPGLLNRRNQEKALFLTPV